MRDINGDFTAGRDINVANRDINIFEHNEQHKDLDKCSIQELLQELPERRKRLKKRKLERCARAPKWLTLPFLGVVIGIYFIDFLQQQLGNHINAEGIWWVFQSLSSQYNPMIIPVAFLVFLLGFWGFPVRHIFNLLFTDDDVMQSHRNAIRQIKHLLAERG